MDFPVCWKCHADLPGGGPRRAAGEPAPATPPRGPEPGSAPGSAPLPLGPSGRRTSRRETAIELGVALLVLWVPSLVASVHTRIEPPTEASTLVDEHYTLLSDLGLGALILYLMWRGGNGRLVSGLSRPRIPVELAWALVLCAVWYFLNVAVSLLQGFFGPGPTETDWGWYEPDSPYTWALVVLSTLVSAAFEECFFRAYLWSRLTRLTRSPFAGLVLSSAMFVAVHPYDVLGSLTLFLQAMIFGTIFWVDRSLWRLILAHALYNLVLTASY